MNRLAVLFLAAIAASTAGAEEVTLEPANTGWNEILMGEPGEPSRNPVRFEKIPAPEEAVVPEGTLRWGRLHVGKKSHLLCLKMEGRMSGSLWLDRDGDLDFREETPVKTALILQRLPSFQLEAVPGEFDVAGTTLSLAMNLQVLPMLSEMEGLVFLNTVMKGDFELDGRTLSMRWFPGGTPHVTPNLPVLGPVELARLRIGAREVSASGDLVVKEGRLLCSCRVTAATGAVACTAPAGLTCLVLGENEKNNAYFPVDGKVHLPAGELPRTMYLFQGATRTGAFDLAVFGEAIEAREGLVLTDHGTVKVNLTAKPGDGKVVFGASILSGTGLRVQVLKDGMPLMEQPRLKILDAEGKVLATHQFASG